MIITIAGNMGSGKTTVAKMLSSKLGYKHYSGGDFMRQMARERGVSLIDLTHAALTDEKIDSEIDAMIVSRGKEEDNFILDGRIAFHFIPHSFKVFLKVSSDEGAKRVFYSRRPDEKENTSLEETKKNIQTRRDIENKRYQSLYGLNQDDISHYDLVIDTTSIPASKVVELILDKLKQTGLQKKA